MKKEVQGEEDTVIWQVVVDVEQTAVQAVFNNGPDAEADGPVCSELEHVGKALSRDIGTVCDRW